MKFRLCPILLLAAMLFVACESGDNGSYGNLGGDDSRGEAGNTENPTTPDVEYIYPGKQWDYATFEECGYKDCSEEIVSYLKSYSDVTSLCVVVGGKMMYEYGDMESTYYLASARKSICSMLYGIAVDRGIIDLSTTIGELIEQGIIDEDLDEGDIKGLLDIEKRATIEHCISARSGVYHQASNTGSTLDDPSKVPARGSVEPGTRYMYSNWDFNVAGAILDGYMGEKMYDMFEREIAQPLQFENWDRTIHSYGGDTSKSIYPAYHFKLTARDMARIGYLMLRKGKWAHGEQIISEEWIAKSTSVISTRQETGNTRFGYGYMWWVFNNNSSQYPAELQDIYAANGSGGQFIVVAPQIDMVLVIKRNKDVLADSWNLSRPYYLLEKIYKNRL